MDLTSQGKRFVKSLTQLRQGTGNAYVLCLLVCFGMEITLGACSLAAEQKPTYQPKVIKPEAIINYLPDGWSWVHTRSAATVRSPTNLFLPNGHDYGNWKELISIIQPMLGGSPAEVIGPFSAAFEQDCDGFKVEPIEEVTGNGYPTATKINYCGKGHSGSGKGGVAIHKAIITKSGAYVISRQLRLDPFDVNKPLLPPEKKTELLNWAKGIYMCDTREPTHPCPPEK